MIIWLSEDTAIDPSLIHHVRLLGEDNFTHIIVFKDESSLSLTKEEMAQLRLAFEFEAIK